MYFVHPQIKLNKENLKSVFLSFFENSNVDYLREKLSSYFSEKQVVFTDMGRTAFKIILEKLNLQNSQILMPAYICEIFYSILRQYNLEPIFLDIDLETFNIKVEEIRNKITTKTKAILISYTYGLPIDIEKLYLELQTSNIKSPFIIEDCAHSFGGKYRDNFVGNFSQASFFSLYKQFPTMRGGILICPKDWQINLKKTNFNFRDFISFLNSFSLFSFLFKKYGQEIAPKMMRKEKTSEPAGINSVSLNFFANFLEDFEKFLPKRIELALFFQEELKKLGFEVQESKDNVFCYLSTLVPKNFEQKRDEIVRKLRKYKIFCTRIWHTPIILNSEVQREYKINLEEFPNTIEAAKRIINFPLQNFYTQRDINFMIKATQKILFDIQR